MHILGKKKLVNLWRGILVQPLLYARGCRLSKLAMENAS